MTIDKIETLFGILQTMPDIPRYRFFDFRWLEQNLADKQPNHPALREALHLVKTIMAEQGENARVH